MNKAKDDYIKALEASADTLQRIVGDHILPEPLDSAGWKRVMSDPNFNAKWSLVFPVEALRGRAKSLRRNDVKKGDWPPFRPEDATQAMDSIEYIRMTAQAWSSDKKFVDGIVGALKPMSDVVQKHGVQKDGVWRFRDQDADPMPKWNPPPAGT